MFRASPRTLLLFFVLAVLQAAPLWAETDASSPDDPKKVEPISVQIEKGVESNVESNAESKTESDPAKKDDEILSEPQAKYLGNKFSQKYHLKGCHFAQIARPGNIFPFASCKEAIKSNYRPCNWCLPKWQKFVKGQILGYPKIREADAKKSSSK